MHALQRLINPMYTAKDTDRRKTKCGDHSRAQEPDDAFRSGADQSEKEREYFSSGLKHNSKWKKRFSLSGGCVNRRPFAILFAITTF